jgi:hypothetical protein
MIKMFLLLEKANLDELQSFPVFRLIEGYDKRA